MIVKPTVNELLEHTENRYALVIEASKRARQIAKGSAKMVETDEKSPVTIAANEIVMGKVSILGENKNEEKEELEEIEEKNDNQDEEKKENEKGD